MTVQPLTLLDGVGNAIRHIGQQRRHLFTACNHTVEDDQCMYPPEHTERALLQNSRMDTVVRFRGLCSNCEERSLIPKAIVEETKRLVTKNLNGIMDPASGPLTEGPVKWAKNRLVVEFKYKKMKQIETDDDEWDVCPVVVWPAVENLSVSGARQWQDVYVNIGICKSSPTLVAASLNILTKVDEFEHKWNEFVQGSRRARNRSSDVDVTQVFPPFPELLPQAARALEDHYRYDDPDLLDTLPYATPEDFNDGI